MKDRPEWELEESYHSDINRKEAKKEKKLASKTDRSKYKKTDLEKQQAKITVKKENELIGRVLSIISQDITVDHDNKLFTCTLRGTLKQEKKRLKKEDQSFRMRETWTKEDEKVSKQADIVENEEEMSSAVSWAIERARNNGESGQFKITCGEFLLVVKAVFIRL